MWNRQTLMRETQKSPTCAKVTILRPASRLEWALAAETFWY
jgi:hypothetical protein